MDYDKIRLVGVTNVDLEKGNLTPTNPVELKAADLGPADSPVTINTGPNGVGVFGKRESQPLQLIFKVGLKPRYAIGQTPEKIREILYGLLSPATFDYIYIQVIKGTTILTENTGWVSKVEPVQFNEKPEVLLTIDLKDSFFRSKSLVSVPAPANKASFSIPNVGSRSVGFELDITFQSAAGAQWRLQNDLTKERLYIDYPFVQGDRLYLNTTPGQRAVRVTKANGSIINLLYAIRGDWPILRGGNTLFTTNGSSSNYTWNSCLYRPTYWGL